MRARYVVDTNVLIAASAGDPVNPAAIEATPEDPALREEVWHWLVRFQNSDTRLVLDRAGKIFDEYMKKLGFNDFGIQVVMHKWSTAAVDDVDVQYDADGHGVLPEPLAEVVQVRPTARWWPQHWLLETLARVHCLPVIPTGTTGKTFCLPVMCCWNP